MTQAFLITLQDPVVTSAHGATASAPEALPYIPGAMLWGLAASYLYQQRQADADEILHSGQTRFSDGLPVLDNGAMALPAPLSLHRSKTAAPHVSAATDFASNPPALHHKQIRGQAITTGVEAKFYKPRRESSQRTAISIETGMAKDGQFFSYDALSPGQQFVATINSDDQGLRDFLTGDHFLGRSKASEFGRVTIAPIDQPEMQLPDTGMNGAIYVWFLSDFWAISETGLPTLCPDAAQFGGTDILWDKSFIRTRQFSPFNAKWQARAEGRTLITRGSVLTLRGSSLGNGLHHFGLGQELGYGQAIVSRDAPLELIKKMRGWQVNLPTSQQRGRHQTALTTWLQSAHDAEKTAQDIADTTKDLITQFKGYYNSALLRTI